MASLKVNLGATERDSERDKPEATEKNSER